MRKLTGGLAIVNMLIFLFIFSMLALTIMTVASSNTRLLEGHIRRNKAAYAAEGLLILRLDQARRGITPAAGIVAPVTGGGAVPWTFNLAGNQVGAITATVAAVAAGAPMPAASFETNSTVNYTLRW